MSQLHLTTVMAPYEIWSRDGTRRGGDEGSGWRMRLCPSVPTQDTDGKRKKTHQRTPPSSVVSPNTESLCVAPFGGCVFLNASVRSKYTFCWPWQPGSMRVAYSHWHWIPLKWLTIGPELVLPAPCKLRMGF